jgi:hypothetical protein
VHVAARTKTMLDWSLWLATFACCAVGPLAALLWLRPLTPGLLATGAGAALAFPSATPPSGWSWACGGRPTRSAGCTPPRA